MPWQPLSLTLKWGAYVKPDEQSQLFMIQGVQEALGGVGGKPCITRRMALEKLRDAGVFEIENISAVLDGLDEEAQQALEQAQAQMAAQTPPGESGSPAKPAPAKPTKSKPKAPAKSK